MSKEEPEGTADDLQHCSVQVFHECITWPAVPTLVGPSSLSCGMPASTAVPRNFASVACVHMQRT